MSEMIPVKPSVLSQIVSISLGSAFRARLDDATLVLGNRAEGQPPKQPRMIVTEWRIISHAGIFAPA